MAVMGDTRRRLLDTRRSSVLDFLVSPNAGGPPMKEQREYYRLCAAAAALGVPVSLDDPRSPRTVAGLRDAVAKASA